MEICATTAGGIACHLGRLRIIGPPQAFANLWNLRFLLKPWSKVLCLRDVGILFAGPNPSYLDAPGLDGVLKGHCCS